MNLRDFLFNFVCPTAKICILKCVNDQILFYGKADAIDRPVILNRAVECVAYDTKAGCLSIRVRDNETSVTYHLPVDQYYVY